MIEHLRNRGMVPELYSCGYDDETACFMLYDFSRRLTGFQQYRPSGDKKISNKAKGKYWSYITKGEVGLFGLESWHFPGPVYLTGGMFKAATLHRLGFCALHVSAVSYKYLKPQLRLLRRPFLAIGDNDAEGKQFSARYGGFTSPRDLDEMTDQEVLCLLKQRM